MARRSRNNSKSVKRDAYIIPSRPLIDNRLLYRPAPLLLQIEDRRSFLPYRPTFKNLMAEPIRPRIRPQRSARRSYMPRMLSQFPREAVVCARRKIRKEVIFATGSGGMRGNKPRYNRSSTSEIICRRK